MAMEPDFTQGCGHFGGNLADIHKPHIRMFGPHSPRKRKVSIKVTSWVGTSAIGAKHIYVRLEVEGNPVWNPNGHWQHCWDDREYDFNEDELPFPIRTQLIYKEGAHDVKITKWVKKTLKKFPADKYEFLDDSAEHPYESIEPKTWSYKSYGD